MGKPRNGYIPSSAVDGNRTDLYREEVPIYENLQRSRDRDRSRSPAPRSVASAAAAARNRAPLVVSGFASATPNYVPASVYQRDRFPTASAPVGLSPSSVSVPSASERERERQFALERSYSTLQAVAASPALSYDVITVNLIRQPSGFGFRVVGGTEEGTAILVGQVVVGGAAQLDGRLDSGDEIMEIDGQFIMAGLHRTAVELLQKAAHQGHVKLVVRRPTKSTRLCNPTITFLES